ncbi:MAG: relaxase/mobilization nuclease domain-containing protein [Bdellovibrionales bacterium]|nr:relaxase/mobilization nuclease domain-containing protein [Bdellovibrionales bacterium]
MAYVKVIRNKDVFGLVDYIFRGREPSDPVIYYDCMEGDVIEQMQFTKARFGKENNDCIHIVQSFSEEDSKLLSSDSYAEIGANLIKSQFPGHEFVVVMHTDTDRIHNHIVVNPVHGETGKKILNKFRVLYDLRDASDRLSVERGLSVIDSQSILKWDRHTDDIRAIKKRGGFSWVIDLKEKCDFARRLSTSFDEYAGILNQFGIEVRVEQKNVQYHYPGHRQKRGGTKGLGRNYTKEGLVEQFRDNYGKFYELGFKTKPIADVNFSDSWKFHRGIEKYIIPEYRIKDSVLPMDVFKKINELDLVQLCRDRKIDLSRNDDGTHSIVGRPYINILEHGWFHTQRGTNGTQLEFLSYLKEEDFLTVLKEFDNSGRIEKLAEQISLNKPSFQAFYLKKSVQGNESFEQMKLAQNLGFSSAAVSSLLKKSKVKFYPNGRLKLYVRNFKNVSLTFHKLADNWICRKHRGINQLFYTSLSSQKKSVLIIDPINLLSSPNILRNIERDTLPFNLVVPLKPLSDFLQEHKETFRGRSNVYVHKGPLRLDWGNTENSARKQIEQDRLMKELGIGYGSIDELLREILIKPLEI